MFSQVIIAFEIDIYGGVFAYESISTANISLTDRENKKWFKIFEVGRFEIFFSQAIFMFYFSIFFSFFTQVGDN